MNNLLEKIINWSEVWALLIPLAIIIIYRPKGDHAHILITYVGIALLLNSVATLMVKFYFSLPGHLRNNNILYNIHSLVRVIFFSWYIFSVRKFRDRSLVLTLLAAYLVFLVFNFITNEPPLYINTLHFVAESILLLIMTLLFFFRSMQDDKNWLNHPAFLVCVGLSLYEAVSFFIWLFFYPLVEQDWEFGDLTMSIYNMIYVVFCVLIAMGLYKIRHANKKEETSINK